MRLGCRAPVAWPDVRRADVASMRPRRVRLGCADAARTQPEDVRRFNEAEARAPRMLASAWRHVGITASVLQ